MANNPLNITWSSSKDNDCGLQFHLPVTIPVVGLGHYSRSRIDVDHIHLFANSTKAWSSPHMCAYSQGFFCKTTFPGTPNSR